MLPLLNAAILTDIAVIIMLLIRIINSDTLRDWYKKFGLAAGLEDVLILVLIFLLATFLYSHLFKKYNIFTFIPFVICIQIIHDLLFGLYVSSYKGKSDIMNEFKSYSKENGYYILFADACMMTSVVLLEKIFHTFNRNTNIIIVICLIYIMPYLIFSVS
jgi:hypothetical protein